MPSCLLSLWQKPPLSDVYETRATQVKQKLSSIQILQSCVIFSKPLNCYVKQKQFSICQKLYITPGLQFLCILVHWQNFGAYSSRYIFSTYFYLYTPTGLSDCLRIHSEISTQQYQITFDFLKQSSWRLSDM